MACWSKRTGALELQPNDDNIHECSRALRKIQIADIIIIRNSLLVELERSPRLLIDRKRINQFGLPFISFDVSRLMRFVRGTSQALRDYTSYMTARQIDAAEGARSAAERIGKVDASGPNMYQAMERYNKENNTTRREKNVPREREKSVLKFFLWEISFLVGMTFR